MLLLAFLEGQSKGNLPIRTAEKRAFSNLWCKGLLHTFNATITFFLCKMELHVSRRVQSMLSSVRRGWPVSHEIYGRGTIIKW